MSAGIGTGTNTVPADMPEHLLSFDPRAFRWSGARQQEYKSGFGDARGMGWKGVSRCVLARPEAVPAGYELRYFEIEPGGYSSLEKHRHAHFIIVLRGRGRALVGRRVLDPVAVRCAARADAGAAPVAQRERRAIRLSVPG
jgi:hypothetical protein